MSHIGPHNFIVSISLGATREFRLRKNYTDGTDPSPIYSIIIPHNSMVIMQAGCQEEYRHSVNSMRTALQVNPISGAARFNLTFRFYPLQFIKQLPRCECNLTMTLRRSFKSIETRGKYFWSCENKYQNKDCGCFYGLILIISKIISKRKAKKQPHSGLHQKTMLNFRIYKI